MKPNRELMTDPPPAPGSDEHTRRVSDGVKFDEGKPRFDLLPPDAMNEVARVYTFGAAKYADRNWEKGMDWGRVYAGQQRHMQAFWGGETHDPETGMLHTAHATFGTLVLTAYQMRSVGKDSRFILPHHLTPAPEPKREIQYKPTRKGVELSAADYQYLLERAGY